MISFSNVSIFPNLSQLRKKCWQNVNVFFFLFFFSSHFSFCRVLANHNEILKLCSTLSTVPSFFAVVVFVFKPLIFLQIFGTVALKWFFPSPNMHFTVYVWKASRQEAVFTVTLRTFYQITLIVRAVQHRSSSRM